MRFRSRLPFTLLLLSAALPATAQPPEGSKERIGIALVIGNSGYAQAELPSVRVDRASMARALHSLGFSVHEVEDLQRPRDFEEEIRTFLKNENATPEDILLLYYSGHGLQIEGRPYLLGTGITGTGEMSSALREYSVDIDSIIRIMEQAAPSARVLIVDACRNNPFAVTPRKAGPAFQRGIEDTYILFADEPGKTVPARSQVSPQSPFTAGLLYALENSEEGIERRFEIASAKTRELNPDQNPQLVKSDSSPNRSRPFLDRGGRRSAPARSAALMLNEAEDLYKAGAWKAFQDKIRAARILSAEPDLTARLDREVQFSDMVLAALTAEDDLKGPEWEKAAAAWKNAGSIFATRAWVLERAALCWLLSDRPQEAAAVLARLQAYTDNPISDRAREMLSDLTRAYPALEPIAKSASREATPPTGPEFEKYPVKQ